MAVPAKAIASACAGADFSVQSNGVIPLAGKPGNLSDVMEQPPPKALPSPTVPGTPLDLLLLSLVAGSADAAGYLGLG